MSANLVLSTNALYLELGGLTLGMSTRLIMLGFFAWLQCTLSKFIFYQKCKHTIFKNFAPLLRTMVINKVVWTVHSVRKQLFNYSILMSIKNQFDIGFINFLL